MKLFDFLYNYFLFKKNNVIYKNFPKIFGRMEIAYFCDKPCSIIIGKNVVINSGFSANPVGGFKTCFAFKGKNAVIEIGDNTGISNVVLAAKERIYIGKNVSLGGGVKIFDTDFHSVYLENRLLLKDPDIRCRPVIVNDGAFIGTNAIILKGVTIGEKSVIGAGSIVTKSVPAGEVWAGNPAKFIKKLYPDKA